MILRGKILDARYPGVSLRAFTGDDVPNKIRWINDPANNRFLHYDLPLEEDKTLAWFENAKRDPRRLDLVIEYNEKALGVIGLLNIDPAGGDAEYYITLGEHEYKRRGISRAASELLFEYARSSLGLCGIYLHVDSDNRPAVALYERLGFVRTAFYERSMEARGTLIDLSTYKIELCPRAVTGVFAPLPELPFIQELDRGRSSNRLFAMRDDLLPFSFGGNKARKAAYFFREIANGGHECVLTYGSVSSNHARITANAAAQLGIRCVIVSPESGNGPNEPFGLSISRGFDAEVVTSPLERVSNVIDETMAALKNEGLNPYFIPGGGHGNTGTRAYFDAYNSLARYEKANGIYFDYIFLASGTGTTQAGLVSAAHLAKDASRRIVGISIARRNPRGARVVAECICDFLGCGAQELVGKVVFDDSFVGEGYGSFDPGIESVIAERLRLDGMPLDPFYTAKAFLGMEEYLAREEITNKNILFLHTGGRPIFFDYLRNKSI